MVDIVEGVNEFAATDMLKALRAVRARINGVFDDPDLVAFGPLGTTTDDILAIIAPAIARGEGAT